MSSTPNRAARALTAVVVSALLGGTAAALALTEQLKLERSPVFRTHVEKLLGPRCRCDFSLVSIDFTLRKADRLTVEVVGRNGQVVRTLLSSRPRRAGFQHFTWNGRDSAGHVVASGIYRPRLRLAREHRTILMPNPIRLDATVPRISLVSLRPRVFSPDGDFRRDIVYIRYRASERARALLYVNGAAPLELKRYAETGLFRWRARGLPAGRYRLVLRARDLAGNLSPPVSVGSVRIRYVELHPHVLHPRTGALISFRVSTDAKSYRWRFGSGGGRAHSRLLVLRAPAPGRYRLVVTANGHSARALVIVEPA